MSSRSLGLAALSLLLASACSGAAPSAPHPLSVVPAFPGVSAPKPASSPARPESFAALRDRVVDRFLAAEPSRGRSAGLHVYDGLLADYSAAGIETRLRELDTQRAALAAVDATTLAPDDALDLRILLGQIDLTTFQLRDVEAHHTRPVFYDELFSVNVYLDRDYAPLAERAAKLVQHEEAALAAVPHIRANLRGPLSRPIVETAVKIYRGYAEYLRGDVKRELASVGDAVFQARFAKVNEALAVEATALAEHLEKVELPRADQSHVLGRARYERLLAAQEGLTTSIAELSLMAEKNLKENKDAYLALRKKGVKPIPTKASELFDVARTLVESSRKFVVERGLVTLPTANAAVVKESPPFMRWNSAFLNAPGPFETATAAYYYISPPDPSWPKAEQEAYLMPKGVLLATSVHEVYPGHYVQGQWERAAPTRAQKLFGAYSFVEGWAHYAEQLMIEEGFGKESPEGHLGQLSDALLRNCRFVASIGVHVNGMSLEDAAKRFETDCFQDKATARQQAVRATFDPGYFAYTLGKVQILALRDEAKKRLGARFSLRDFHDALLSHGSPPVPLLRERVLAELEAKAAKATP